MKLKGTKFQLMVWRYLIKIPRGKVKTYKEIATDLKKPNSARAIANACAKNPYAPTIPCHRVISSKGSLGGYNAGLEKKIYLLRHEGAGINFKK